MIKRKSSTVKYPIKQITLREETDFSPITAPENFARLCSESKIKRLELEISRLESLSQLNSLESLKTEVLGDKIPAKKSPFQGKSKVLAAEFLKRLNK